MSPDELNAKVIELSSQNLETILQGFETNTVSIYHQVYTPHRSTVLNAQRENAEQESAATFWALALDLYQYDAPLAVKFAIRGAGLDKVESDSEIRHLDACHQKKIPAIGYLKLKSLDLLDAFNEQGYDFVEPEALKWLTIRNAVRPDQKSTLE